MELNYLQPQMIDEAIYKGDGGGYYSSSSSKFPLLSEAKVGAGKLFLQPRAFALPHYSDSSKIGYVLQGKCIVGMVSPNSPEEKVLIIKKGDAIPVPLGAVSWWFNDGDSEEEVVIIFLGETTRAHIPGEFTYFFLTGTLGLLGAFSTELISRAYDIDEKESKKLAESQTGALIIEIEKGIKMPRPSEDATKKIVFNIDNALPEVDVKNGGTITVLTKTNISLLEQVGLSASIVKLDANAALAPMYTTDSSVQIIYVKRGSGRIQIVGATGKSLLDTKVQEGHLFVVPRFFAAAKIADGEGMECFSVITSSEPEFGQLGGKTSVWKALSPVVLQESLGVTPELVKLFKSKIEKGTIITPPRN